MRVLVACEFSGIVREAFRARGHEAMSCDLEETEIPGWHHRGPVQEIIRDGWDLMIAHPPCTHLAVSGARWFKEKQKEQSSALDFVRYLLDAPIKHIALENPVSIISSRIRTPDQIVHPYWFGDTARKATCWWLKNLPKLRPTNMIARGLRTTEIADMPDRASRQKDRSRTFQGMAQAMAEQWG